jgi:predicted metalloprotease with PDZ domain
MAQEGDRLLVRSVIAGSAAYQQGLNAGDQIVAFDGARATLEFVLARLKEKKPGELVRLTIFRFDELRMIELTLGERKTHDYKILPVANPTEQQKKIYQDWLNAPLMKS